MLGFCTIDPFFEEKHENARFFQSDAQLVRRFSKCSNFSKMKVSDQEISIFKRLGIFLRSKTDPFESKSKFRSKLGSCLGSGSPGNR